jgi:hypothetical protein
VGYFDRMLDPERLKYRNSLLKTGSTVGLHPSPGHLRE